VPVKGKVLVFAANAVIFMTLALLGWLLSAQLASDAAECGDDPDAICERSMNIAESSRIVSTVLAVIAVVLAVIAWALHARDRPSG
jgi:hypothetical protein